MGLSSSKYLIITYLLLLGFLGFFFSILTFM